MIDVLTFIVESIGLLFNLVVSMINSIFSFFTVLLSAITLPTTLMTYAPWPLATSIMCVVSFSVIKLIIGRQ